MMDTRGWFYSLAGCGLAFFLGTCTGQEGMDVCEDGQALCQSNPSPNLDLLATLASATSANTCQPTVDPRLLSDPTDLFNEIDGAAPKYIDRGWVKSAYGSYQCGGIVLLASIHDLNAPENATALFTYDSPASESAVSIDSRPNTIVDTSLPTAYASKAHFGQYYYEVSVADKTPAGLTLIKAVTVQLLEDSARPR